MTLKKLKINACTVDEEEGTLTVEDSVSFEVMINPAKYTVKDTIEYDYTSFIGQLGQELKFSSVQASVLNFKIVIDGTGVVNHSKPGKELPDVKTEVGKLRSVIYTYVGEKHEPNRVRLLWGTMVFYGRLTSMSIDYTLFKPSGNPLRANVDLNFKGFMTKKEQVMKANMLSPDLTRLVDVKAGDTLPQLCYRFYKDCTYYTKVARENNISSLRNLKPGTKLYFPPLK
ncbi:MAG: LysM peptidoglycan-binding domain-containing protein [Planctomycetes bacterium]|nr:LysM peptidoglycan-binding domain-containing protein [Planctomycetota bacterium]